MSLFERDAGDLLAGEDEALYYIKTEDQELHVAPEDLPDRLACGSPKAGRRTCAGPPCWPTCPEYEEISYVWRGEALVAGVIEP